MLQTKDEIKDWLYRYGIDHYLINENLTVDVNGSVHIRDKALLEFPIQFGIVDGHFDCSNNYLYTLKGSPFQVNGTFNCGKNDLTTLKYSPKIVNGNFLCKLLPLYSLKDFDCEVGGYFYHSYKSNNEDIIAELKEYYQNSYMRETMIQIDGKKLKSIMLKIELDDKMPVNENIHKIKKTKI